MNRSPLYKSTSVKSGKAKSRGSVVGQYTALSNPSKQSKKKTAISKNLGLNPYLKHTVSKPNPFLHGISLSEVSPIILSMYYAFLS